MHAGIFNDFHMCITTSAGYGALVHLSVYVCLDIAIQCMSRKRTLQWHAQVIRVIRDVTFCVV